MPIHQISLVYIVNNFLEKKKKNSREKASTSSSKIFQAFCNSVIYRTHEH